MSVRLKTTVAAVALLGIVAGSVAFAEKGPAGQGPAGQGDRGAMFLEMFDAIDADQDGKVTLAEMEAHRTAMFAAHDANGDGKMDAEELSARQLARFTESLADRTARMIDNRDADGDGSLSLAELDAGPGQRGFARMDTDNDGAISKAELEAAGDDMRKGRKHRKGGMWGWNN